MAEVVKMGKEEKEIPEQEAPKQNSSEQEQPDMEKLAKEHMDKFMKSWKKMNNKDKHDTLLNMMLNLAYRMDILASVVSGLDEVKDMKNVFEAGMPQPPQPKGDTNE
ncbi:MAG: hypothetical protein H8E55_55805 [Pelagibacterales bacterium]|nr:hypothetical protein [Pelagibacterales bacterium]